MKFISRPAILLIFLTVYFVSFSSCSKKPISSTAQKEVKMLTGTSGGFQYQYVEGDPLATRIYTLENGLKVYLSKIDLQPTIGTAIAVRTGSKNDPADNTGLSHYLEHIMFKGTTKLGTKDWAKEKILLDSIEQLFELHKKTTDTTERKKIYKQIDELSFRASQIAIANEYDQSMEVVGATGTNAFTNNDMTVYINDIPSNQLERWLNVESERFSTIVNRLFHTELEAVYEEKNISIDNDGRRTWEAMNYLLYPNHTYGTQTTIGRADHLKNPSITAIKKHFETYYVPNNMAVILTGDLDYDKSIQLIASTMGKLPRKKDPEGYKEPVLAEFSAPKDTSVSGPDPASVMLGYRVKTPTYYDQIMLELFSGALYFSNVGIMDLELNQKQKVLESYCFNAQNSNYCSFILAATPREGQELNEVKSLLLQQIESLKKGNFPDWLPEAVANQKEIQYIRSFEYPNSLKGQMYGIFINNLPYEEKVKKYETMRSITKKDIMDYANKYFNSTYVTVFKEQGQRKDLPKVLKPAISPVELNRGQHSPFFESIKAIKSPELKPQFPDLEKEVSTFQWKPGVELWYAQNKRNDLFYLYFKFQAGKTYNPLLSHAVSYLDYCGAGDFDATGFKNEMFKLGCSYYVFTAYETVYVYLSGLDRNKEKAFQLFQKLLTDPKGDQTSYDNFVNDILKERENNKKNKGQVQRGLEYYAKFGPKNPFNTNASEKTLKEGNPELFTNLVKQLPFTIEHRIEYFGPSDFESFKDLITKNHKAGSNLKTVRVHDVFTEQLSKEPKIFVAHYDMVQAFVTFLGYSSLLTVDNLPAIQLYNHYFSGGMSSEVFQEIREKRALAYSANGRYEAPPYVNRPCYQKAFIGTQADKLIEAIDAMEGLIKNASIDSLKFLEAKSGWIAQETPQRVYGSDLFDVKIYNRDLNYKGNAQEMIFRKIETAKKSELEEFKAKYVKNVNFNLLLVGDTAKIPYKNIKGKGAYTVVPIEDIFGY